MIVCRRLISRTVSNLKCTIPPLTTYPIVDKLLSYRDPKQVSKDQKTNQSYFNSIELQRVPMNPQIVVIGAGASGVAAATYLLEQGHKNLIILEAENRIGGRVHTIPFANNVVDLGAQWCHGEKDNVVFELTTSVQSDLLESNTAKYDRFELVRSDGKVIDKSVSDRLVALAVCTVELYKEEIAAYEGSLGNFVTKKFRELLTTDPEYKDICPELAFQFLDFFHRYENSIEASDSWFETSARGYLEYWDCEGDRLLNWKDKGYRTILTLLQRKKRIDSHIMFQKRVTQIEWNREHVDKSACVRCSDGTSYDADFVIFTGSLGVLKETYRDMFVPRLPAVKANAIEGLTLGTVDKLYLEFETPFWPSDWEGFSLIWSEKDLVKLRASDQPSWLEDVFGFYVVDYQPNILCGWISGARAREMERDTEENVKAGAVHLLRMFLKKWKVTDPVNFKRTQWFSNPNFRGSYTFRSTTTDLLRTSPADLAKPLTNSMGVPVLCFAGEATSDHYYSTVHGAVESGWREAKRICELVQRPKSRM